MITYPPKRIKIADQLSHQVNTTTPMPTTDPCRKTL